MFNRRSMLVSLMLGACCTCTTSVAASTSSARGRGTARAVAAAEPPLSLSDVCHIDTRLQPRQTYGTDTTYTTTTMTVYVGANRPAASATELLTSTVYVTDGASVTPANNPNAGGTYTTTVYVSPTIATVAGILTTVTRTTLTVSTITSTSTLTQQQPSPTRDGDNSPPVNTKLPLNTVCLPGDANEKYGGVLSATPQQRQTLYIMSIYILGILIAWNLTGVKLLLYPMKMLVISYHEFWHVLVGVCFGQKVVAVELAPDRGGWTNFVEGAPVHASPQPIACYFVAMVGNALLGSLLVFCGFNTLASKIVSFFIGLTFCAIIWYAATPVLLVLTAAWVGLMIGLWFIYHGLYLKYYVLFLGVMTALYVFWDVMDDLVFRKPNPCCPMQVQYRFTKAVEDRLIPVVPAFPIVLGWIGISILFFAVFVVLAILVFRQTPHGEYCQAATFLPT